MTWDGMHPQHPCKGCGKLLNQDGGHPAELYAGTYTGLCYDCEQKPAYGVAEYLDGGKCVSHPPDQPSYRRDRHTYVWYPDCPDHCRMGTKLHHRVWPDSSSYRASCPTCSQRHAVYLEERERKQLRGSTPFEHVAERLAQQAREHELEARKPKTKTRAAARKKRLAVLAGDEEALAAAIRMQVVYNQEAAFLSRLEALCEAQEQGLPHELSVFFEDSTFSAARAVIPDLRTHLGEQQAIKRRQTRVLIAVAHD